MNSPQTIESGKGLLKNYDPKTNTIDPTTEALKRRIEKMKEKIVVPTKEDVDPT